MKARNSEGLSPQSSYVNVETLAESASSSSAPATPTGLAGSVSHDSVSLTWQDPEDDSITGYQVLRRSRDGDEYEDGQGAAEFVAVVDDTGSAATSYTDTSVTARTRYVYRVKARNSEGLSPQSSYVNVETLAAPKPPAKPADLEASAIRDNSVTFEWDDPEDDSITHYKVRRSGGDSKKFKTIEKNTRSADTTYTDSEVSAETKYKYRVIAVNGIGESPESDSLGVQTLPAPSSTRDDPDNDEPEPEDAAIAEEQREVTIINRGTLEVDPPVPTRGTIESPGERHRYEVGLQSGRFYELYLREGSTGEIRLLLDHEGTPVQYDGRDVVSAPHAAWSGRFLFYQPTTGSTYVVEVRASDDQQTGSYALMVRDNTITASSDHENAGKSNDFGAFINRAKLHPDDPVSGRLNRDGHARAATIDTDYFEANLHAGQTYTFTYSASSVDSGATSNFLSVDVHGPGPYRNLNNYSPNFGGGSRVLVITITPGRTGAYVFSINVFGPGGGLPSAYTVTLAEQ